MNPYLEFVATYARLVEQGKTLPHGVAGSNQGAGRSSTGPKALIFSPHPDDECIVGGLALRLAREGSFQVANVAVTQGSKKSRQAGRLAELRAACDFIGYDLIQTGPNGLEGVNSRTRSENPAQWKSMAGTIAAILERETPRVIFVPHAEDWNSSHVGTHLLVADALAELGTAFQCLLVETEYWGAMKQPNLMVESSVADVADMVAGVSFHIGEVTRNPFHLFLPAWMQDNVRRGSELVGGQGEAAPDFKFATLYRLLQWNGKVLQPPYVSGRQIACSDSIGTIFPA